MREATGRRPPPRLREALALARQGTLMLRGLRRAAQPVDGERAVVFVHGFLAAGPVFDPMREHVEDRTGLSTVDFTYSPLAGFERIVERFGEHVERMVPPSATVSVVGHSLGGLVARWWVQEMGGHARTDRVVTIATPHAGTDNARNKPGSVAAALRPGSPVIERLARRRREVDLPHAAIAAGFDRMCTPPSSAAALEDAEVHWFEDLGHNEILYDPRVLALVAELLSAS